MKDQFVPYEIAKMLKELGFDEECISYYWESDAVSFHMDAPECVVPISNSKLQTLHKRIENCSRPSYCEVKQWLWNKHKIWVKPWRPYAGEDQINGKYVYSCIDCTITDGGGTGICDAILDEVDFDSPITAEIEGIKSAVQHLYKNK